MTVTLKAKFMGQLDMHSSQLIKVIRAKGGATWEKTTNIMQILDQVHLLHFSLYAKENYACDS